MLDNELHLDTLNGAHLNAVGEHKGINLTTTRVTADSVNPLPTVAEKRVQLRAAYGTELPESQRLGERSI